MTEAQKKKIRRIMIAAPKSGSGKTTITCGLLQIFKENGEDISSCKCGPDYIDPMFHRQVLGVPSRNLDTFFTGEEGTRKLFLKDRREDELVVMEGVMGLYDGLGGIREEGSSYHLAKVTQTPILLVVDAKGMGRSVIPLISGFLAYDKAHLIRGVIFNRMSAAYYEILKPLAEDELGIAVLGYFPENKDLQIASRHLGLCMPGELEDLQGQIRMTAERLRETADISKLLQIAEEAEPLEEETVVEDSVETSEAMRPRIAVAWDEAFCFYYEENLRLLEQAGAEPVYFSPLHDRNLPENIHGLLLGGGYPELYAGQLSENDAMRTAIRKAVTDGLPTVAECGGFLYLHTTLTDREGHSYPMAGVLPGKCFDTGHLVRFGYIELEENSGHFMPRGSRIRAHEFHYYDSEDNGADCIATKPSIPWRESCPVNASTPDIWCASDTLNWKRTADILCLVAAASVPTNSTIMTVKTTAQTASLPNPPPDEIIPVSTWERVTGTVFPTSIIHPARSSRSASWRMQKNSQKAEKICYNRSIFFARRINQWKNQRYILQISGPVWERGFPVS